MHILSLYVASDTTKFDRAVQQKFSLYDVSSYFVTTVYISERDNILH